MNTKNILVLGMIGIFALTSCSDDDSDDMMQEEVSANLYATSHANGDVTRYNLTTNSVTTISTSASDAEGIYYSPDDDSFTLASRGMTQTSLQTYVGISDIITATINLTVDISSQPVLQNPRDLAVNGNFYVVADSQNANAGRFFVFEKSNGSLTLSRTITTDFSVWGIEFIGNDLYAVVDNTNELAVFTNFLSSNTADATVSASKRIAIEGIGRTHGIAFDGGTLIMSDIAAASGPGADTDGGFHVITNFMSKFNAVANGGTLAVGQQIRYAGAATMMGNPVNVEYDAASDTVYVAELANGGGRVLAFGNVSTAGGGNATPAINNSLSGVSSLYFYRG
ncbi:hypothetical protein [Leeuwenhoekiella nanhaiensis]|uniref:Uncharacterized protein n=1 Tax=Leeuwenhoekiella nanhaiensis TaxID=1655491 RepID=A0A2G1VUB1_9FLAO|nr:hypothetical protein [Leeuwenhoekiella nanhaiensis]PHQ30372.1 hypothetical protein CJ305_05260 [Leeuwenhoekiella nanhaiensis]